MPDRATIFDFERGFAGSLRCIPMVVRFELDHCGIKLTLRQWAKFTREERARLVDAPCDTTENVNTYGNYLAGRIERERKIWCERSRSITRQLGTTQRKFPSDY